MKFTQENLRGLWKPENDSAGEDNGQVTIVGASKLFTGAALMSLQAASRIVDMVFFSSEEKSVEEIVKVKAGLSAFIYVPFEEVEAYIKKSDAILIGPGLMRFRSEMEDPGKREVENEVAMQTKKTTETLFEKFPEKKWVIDAGSLQVIEARSIPKGAIVTPNNHEFERLFGATMTSETVRVMAGKYGCVIVGKGPVGYVSDGNELWEIDGGNAGLTKGGSGDVLAGLMVGLFAKNSAVLAAASATYILKKTAEKLFETVGFGFNSEDLARKVFEVKKELVGY